MKVKPVKEKKSINYPKLAVLTAAVSITAVLGSCEPQSNLVGDINIQESDSYVESGTSGENSSGEITEVTLDGDVVITESRTSSECSDESKDSSSCSDTSTEVALIGETPESSN